MRFIENGPNIPEELLTARDEGKVIFFCGAGVSRAFVGLSNFVTLASKVVDELGSLTGSRARQLLDAANFTLPSGEKVPVAVDKMFSLLDQEFEPHEVRNAVARALLPPSNPDLKAHRILLDLSTGVDGRPRLVTTNFDLLFEACDQRLRSSSPGSLPSPERPADFEGVIHLHGRTNDSYTALDRNAVVLSSSDFGRAYLSEGWATNYIRSLMNRYKIVFIGYSADDPPVQYLLEALRDDQSPVVNLYAFQDGDEARAREQWAQKGVVAIPYGDQYDALWETLEAWAVRARSPVDWYRDLITKASAGPEAASPTLRGRVASIASEFAGARAIVTSTPKLPSTWLYSFDPEIRYLRPMRSDYLDPDSGYFDPFQKFGIDRDEQPPAIDLEDHFAKRDVPQGAWNAFTGKSSSVAGGVGEGDFFGTPPIPDRIWQLAQWLLNSMSETPAIWWAAGTKRLHPNIRSALANSVRYSRQLAPDPRRYWRMLIQSWSDAERGDIDQAAIELQRRAKHEGWSPILVREAVRLHRPRFTVNRANGVAPPLVVDAKLGDFIRLGVDYPHAHTSFEYDDKHLPLAVSLWRDLLVEAEQMESEVSPWLTLDTTRPEDGEVLDETYYGLTGPLVAFTHLIERLEKSNPQAASREFQAWQNQDGRVFDRLRIWAAGRSTLTSSAEAEQVFVSLSDQVFWSGEHERDLLFAISDRWDEISATGRSSIENRLLYGPILWLEERDDDDDESIAEDVAASAATYRLSNIQWLLNHGVAFGFDLQSEMGRLRAINPRWNEEYADSTAQPHVSGVYSVTTETSAGALVDLPVGKVLPMPSEERKVHDTVRYDRFVGYSEAKPAKAIQAIHSAIRRGIPTATYWASFFRGKPLSAPSPRLFRVLAAHMENAPSEDVARFWYPLVDWMSQHAVQLEQHGLFDRFWKVIVNAAQVVPSGYRAKRDRDWAFEALNSVVGRLARVLFQIPLPNGDHSVPALWLARMTSVLSLPGAHAQHALHIMARQLNWLFLNEPQWTTTNLIDRSRLDEDTAEAFWSGIVARGHVPQDTLFQLLKPNMLARVGRGGRDARHLVGMLLMGWGGVGSAQQVSDGEMRDTLILSSNESRLSALHHLGEWAGKKSEWADKLVPFLLKVWPKQRTVRTAAMSAALFSLASRSTLKFADAIDALKARLVPLSKGDHFHFWSTVSDLDLRGAAALVEALGLLLPEERSDWPYGAKDLVEELGARIDAGSVPGLKELAERASEDDAF